MPAMTEPPCLQHLTRPVSGSLLQAAQAAQPTTPTSETSRLSALERLRRVAAEAEGRTAPLGAAAPKPAPAPAASVSSKDDVLARLREELQRAEAKIHANASRASGTPVPAAANASPSRQSSSVRRASPARTSPTRGISPFRWRRASEEAPAADAPPEEGPTAFNHPLSAVEKLRKALEDTHARLDDKKASASLARAHAPRRLRRQCGRFRCRSDVVRHF